MEFNMSIQQLMWSICQPFLLVNLEVRAQHSFLGSLHFLVDPVDLANLVVQGFPKEDKWCSSAVVCKFKDNVFRQGVNKGEIPTIGPCTPFGPCFPVIPGGPCNTQSQKSLLISFSKMYDKEYAHIHIRRHVWQQILLTAGPASPGGPRTPADPFTFWRQEHKHPPLTQTTHFIL